MKLNASTLFSIAVLLSGSFAIASPPTFSYQGRVVGVNGIGLEAPNVAFEFSVTSPDGSCVLFREQKTGLDMRNSKGIFETPIGSGNKFFPASPTFTILDAFNNSTALTCEAGGIYTPAVDASRLLRVQLFDGSSWRLIVPDSTIRSVPFAAYAAHATSAAKLGTKIAADFVAKSDLPLACAASEALTWTLAGFSCVSAGAGGTVLGYTPADELRSIIAGTGLTGGGSLAADRTLAVNVGSGANQIPQLDGSGKLNASVIPAGTSGTAGGDLTGSYPNPTLASGAAGTLSKIVASPGSAGTNRLLATDTTTGTTVKDFYCTTVGHVIKWTGASGFGCAALASSDITSFNTDVDARITAKRGAASGIASLTASTLVPTAQLGTGTASGTTYLRGDGTWATPASGGGTPAGSTGEIQFNNAGAFGSSSSFFWDNTNAKLGIGTATPAEKIHVVGNIRADSFIQTSDRRLKRNIASIHGLELIQNLRGVKYIRRATGKSEYGLIAQEVEAVAPEFVSTDPETGIKGVQYQNLVSPLIEAVKESDQQCRADIQELKDENKKMRQELTELKQMMNIILKNQARINE